MPLYVTAQLLESNLTDSHPGRKAQPCNAKTSLQKTKIDKPDNTVSSYASSYKGIVLLGRTTSRMHLSGKQSHVSFPAKETRDITTFPEPARGQSALASDASETTTSQETASGRDTGISKGKSMRRCAGSACSVTAGQCRPVNPTNQLIVADLA